VLKPGQVVSEQELQSHLAGRLARYKLPRRWLRLSALPKTALGKVQRQALAQLAGLSYTLEQTSYIQLDN
jgi:fatty-acyl-CoA synthase